MNRLTEIFIQYLTLGLISFGGPAAHVGYFHKVFVEQRQWLDDAAYARLLSLSQLLPGPGSSQMGFAIGLHRGGIFGAFVAFLAFTFPSFVLMYLLSSSHAWLNQNPWFTGLVTGLKLFAVVVVADATLKMFHKFCTRKASIGIAVATAAFLLVSASLFNQILVLIFAAVAGMMWFNPVTDTPQQLKKTERDSLAQHSQAEHGQKEHSQANHALANHTKINPNHANNTQISDTKNDTATDKTIGWGALAVFFILLALLSIIPFNNQWMQLFAQFYQAGSLVFGGGHVVLPLLQEIIGTQMSHDRFLMGYAAAQAVPGPMFSLASFLGAELSPNNQLGGALIASAGIFLPGFLLVIALHGAWEKITSMPKVAGAIWGINAAVVGLLMTALFSPVFTSAISHADNANIRMSIVLVGFFALQQLNVKIVWLALAFAVIGVGLQLLS